MQSLGYGYTVSRDDDERRTPSPRRSWLPRARRLISDPIARRRAVQTRLVRTQHWLRSRSLSPSPAASNPTAARLATLGQASVPVTNVVLIIGRDARTVANQVADALPDASLHLLTVDRLPRDQVARLRSNVTQTRCRSINQRVDYLSVNAQPQIIIERGNNRREQKVACFTELFPFLAIGGIYRVEALEPHSPGDPPNICQLLRDIEAILDERSVKPANNKIKELAASADLVEIGRESAVVRKAVAHQYMIRDRDANALLGARFGSSWGAVIAQQPPTRWVSGVKFAAHGAGPALADKSVIDVPELSVRRYDSALCLPRQRLRYGDYWLPDTFRHAQDSVLSHRRLITASRHMARSRSDKPLPTRTVAGRCFYFDTEFPTHFGHVITEVVSRYWGWQAASTVAPDLRPLVGLWTGQTEMPYFQRLIFDALGIDTARVEYLRLDEAVKVDALYAATPKFVMPQYATPDLLDVWNKVRRRCEDTSDTYYAERLFVSRKPKKIRTCLNALEVEAMFERLGFDIIYPEDLAFGRQIRLFSHARVIAGFGGSGMFNSMFAPGSTVIVISADGYRANNEYLIRAVAGGEIHYFWADGQVKQPSKGFSWEAYQANFTFDVRRYEPTMERIANFATR